METFDLAISYVWKYDREFVDLIEKILHDRGLTTFIIAKFNVNEVIERIRQKELRFKAYLDRASDEDSEFTPIITLLQKRNCYIINPHKHVIKAIDKSNMHRRLEKKNFRLPKTFLIPTYEYNSRLNLVPEDLDEIGIPFVIKPALISGGGEGVIKNAEFLEQIQIEREKNPNEKYLIQEKILPRKINGRRAWFRVIWAFGRAIPTWWNDQTHIYQKVTKKEVERFNLLPLLRITSKLARITKLDYFSTEIALTKDHQFKMIDYVNDQCDMRLKSNHVDGVPDEVVSEFIERMRKKVSTL
jgi:hypothetical protein